MKQEYKVSYRCSLPSPLQRTSEDYQGLHTIPLNSRCFFKIRIQKSNVKYQAKNMNVLFMHCIFQADRLMEKSQRFLL